MFTKQEMDVIRYMRNYVMHEGELPSIRKLMKALGYKSPRSISLIFQNLISKGILQRRSDGRIQLVGELHEDKTRAQTVEVPLVGRVACGAPMLAEENVEAMIPVSLGLAKPPHKYFLLKAKGDSMNEKGINDGDIVLVRQQQIAKTGDSIVALIDDEATIKELKIDRDAIVLKPRSANKKHQPIILNRDFHVQGVVVAVVPDF